MMTLDERLIYLEKIEAAQETLLSDPEIAAEYDHASQAWNSTIGASLFDAHSGRSSAEPCSAGVSTGLTLDQFANRLKKEESFHRGFSSRLATRSSNLATRASKAPAADLSRGWFRSSDGAW